MAFAGLITIFLFHRHLHIYNACKMYHWQTCLESLEIFFIDILVVMSWSLFIFYFQNHNKKSKWAKDLPLKRAVADQIRRICLLITEESIKQGVTHMCVPSYVKVCRQTICWFHFAENHTYFSLLKNKHCGIL